MSAHQPPVVRITRRQCAALLGTAPLLAQVTSTVPPQGLPAPSNGPASPEQRLQKAYADVRRVSERLSKIEVPMTIEPAFSFRTYG
jgi:hypothetical protein